MNYHHGFTYRSLISVSIWRDFSWLIRFHDVRAFLKYPWTAQDRGTFWFSYILNRNNLQYIVYVGNDIYEQISVITIRPTFLGRILTTKCKDLWHIWSIWSVYLSISFAKIGLKCTDPGLKCTDWPQVYGIGLKCTDRPQIYSCLVYLSIYLSIYLSTLLKSVHLRPICTFEADLYEADFRTYIWGQFSYIWGWSDSTGRGRLILGPLLHLSRPVLLISRPIALPCPVESDQPQMYKSASNVQLSIYLSEKLKSKRNFWYANSFLLKCTWLCWGQLRYIWGRFKSYVQLKSVVNPPRRGRPILGPLSHLSRPVLHSLAR